MKFEFRTAGEQDVESVMKLMREASEYISEADWFAGDDEETVRNHVTREGFILLAQYKGSDSASVHTAAFLIVRFPREAEDNLGEYVGVSTAEGRAGVVHLETAVVSRSCRGNGLQYRMFQEAERILTSENRSDGKPYRYLMATVHPDNTYSLKNMEKLGCRLAADTVKYGGKRRLVMFKELTFAL